MKETLEKCWQNVIVKYFNKGLIGYERQLQVYFFLELKEMLPDYGIWVEPTIFLYKEYDPTRRPTMDGRIPDILITKDKTIEAVIELKCKPWDSVQFDTDLEKLKHFEELASTQKEIPLSWPPISSNWSEQISHSNGELYFEFKRDALLVFAVIAKANTKSVLDLDLDIKNFLHLKYSIEDKWEFEEHYVK